MCDEMTFHVSKSVQGYSMVCGLIYLQNSILFGFPFLFQCINAISIWVSLPESYLLNWFLSPYTLGENSINILCWCRHLMWANTLAQKVSLTPFIQWACSCRTLESGQLQISKETSSFSFPLKLWHSKFNPALPNRLETDLNKCCKVDTGIDYGKQPAHRSASIYHEYTTTNDWSTRTLMCVKTLPTTYKSIKCSGYWA